MAKRRVRQTGGIAGAAVVKGVVAGVRAARAGIRAAKKHRVLTRATRAAERAAPKRVAKFRKKHPRLAKLGRKLRQRGFGRRLKQPYARGYTIAGSRVASIRM